MGAMIETRKLTKRYGDLVAVDELDLTIQEGEIFGLLGPNGAGKTTTILMLLGLTEPTSGEVRVLGEDATRHPRRVKSFTGYLPDSVGFYDQLTGRENLRFTARLNRLPEREAEERIDLLLRQVGLEDAGDQKVGSYSRGMRQRLGLADVLVKEPRLVILDEPTTGLDPEGAQELLELIRRLRREHRVTILLSSHDLHQVQETCDRVGIFVQGRLIAQGEIGSLGRRLFGDEPLIEVGVEPLDGAADRLQQLEEVEAVTVTGPHLLVHSRRDIRPVIARTLVEEGYDLKHLALRERGLDEIYRRYFREGSKDAKRRTA